MRIPRLRNSVLFSALLLCLGWVTAASGASVLVTSSGDAHLDAITVATLASFGHDVQLGPAYSVFDDTIDLSAFNAVLLLANNNWGAGDMPITGQENLLNFVASGGGLVTSEWNLWKHATLGQFAELYDAFPVVGKSNYNAGSPITYTVVTADPILDDGVDTSFTFQADSIGGTESDFAPKDGATVYFQSAGAENGAGVIGWGYGSGLVISLSTLIGPNELADVNYSQLLSNALTWASTPQ